ncbi:thioredoxin [Jeotgalibacillus aurantiacus]|uniref:thioredoxin n=1 Tax=Jeotgalibacillus aurantiacus TaxID=2763266 RepID=UPI001D09F5A0|nr:thioredoxin [Jeotgalibacillus aurantiacus]
MLELTKESFNNEVKKDIVLVDFGASWCPPCRMQEPVLEELLEELSDRVSINKVDTDAQPELASQFSIMGLPTLLLFKKGQLKETMRGFHTKEQILRKIEEVY